jgi:iron(III) transport system substrate-binding protein
MVSAASTLAAEPSIDELYTAAKVEPPLNWYEVPLSATVAERLAAGFSEKYPGLKVVAQRSPAQTFFQKVEQEVQSGTPGADVFTSSITAHLATLKAQGQLLRYTPRSEATMIDLPGVKGIDPDGYYHGTFVYAVTLVYNTKQLTAADAPHALGELIEPKWAGKVAVPNPGTSGTFGVLTVQLAKTYGIGYFEKLADNKAMVVRSLPDVVATVQAGEAPVGIAPASIALEAKARGEPIDVIYQTDGVLPAISVTGIIKKTKSPNAAKLFMEYLHSADTSRIVASDFNETLHASVPPPAGLKTLASVKTALPSDQEVDETLPKVVRAWRDAFGM